MCRRTVPVVLSGQMHCQLASSSILLAWHIPCFSLSGCLGRCVKPAACCVGLSLGQLVCLLASYLHCCRGLCRRPRTLMCPRFLPMWPVAAHISWGFGVFALACCLLCCSCTHMGVVRQVHAWPGAAHGRFAGCIHPDNVCSPVWGTVTSCCGSVYSKEAAVYLNSQVSRQTLYAPVVCQSVNTLQHTVFSPFVWAHALCDLARCVQVVRALYGAQWCINQSPRQLYAVL